MKTFFQQKFFMFFNPLRTCFESPKDCKKFPQSYFNQLQTRKRQHDGLGLLQRLLKNVKFESEISMKMFFFIKIFSSLHYNANMFQIIQRMWETFIVVSQTVNGATRSIHLIQDHPEDVVNGAIIHHKKRKKNLQKIFFVEISSLNLRIL